MTKTDSPYCLYIFRHMCGGLCVATIKKKKQQFEKECREGYLKSWWEEREAVK